MKGSVRKKGDTWYYRITVYVNGKRKYIERKGGATKAAAERALRKAIDEYEGTGNVRQNEEIQVEEYLDFWFKNYVMKELRYRTQQDYKNKIYKHFIPYFKNYKLKAITPELLQKYLYDKKDAGLSRRTLNGHKGTLNIAFKMAVYPYKKLTENPMQYVKMPTYEEINSVKESEKIITTNDWKKINKRFPLTNHFGLVLNILYYSALRESECCGLTWDDIDFDNKTLSVNHQLVLTSAVKNIIELHFGPTKTKMSNANVIIGDSLLKILQNAKEVQKRNAEDYGEYYTCYYKDANNKIFSLLSYEKPPRDAVKVNFVCVKENGELVNTNTLKYCARVIHHDLGIGNFTFHRLRHTHASILISNGANMKAVQSRLRHSNIQTTMNTYSHLLKETEEETANLFDELVK